MNRWIALEIEVLSRSTRGTGNTVQLELIGSHVFDQPETFGHHLQETSACFLNVCWHGTRSELLQVMAKTLLQQGLHLRLLESSSAL